MKRQLAAAAILVLGAMPVPAHRLDEYLQGTLFSVEKTSLQAQITLTPGVAILPIVIADIDTDRDGTISEAEQRAYAGRVLRDLLLAIDGRRLTLQLSSMRFPTIDDMKEGRGEIQIEFHADFPPGDRNRKLTFENHHESRIAAYQVNALVPSDPDIRIVKQTRNYLQSTYQLDYAQSGARFRTLSAALWTGDGTWLGLVALLLSARFAWLWRRRALQ
jgi:hypothetical protein